MEVTTSRSMELIFQLQQDPLWNMASILKMPPQQTVLKISRLKIQKFHLNRLNTSSIGIYQTYITSPTSAAGANSYNKFYNITIENAYNGIYLLGLSAYPDLNTEIGITGSGQTTIGASTANDIGNGSSTIYG